MVKNLPAIEETVGSICVGMNPWKRGWLPTLVFLPGELHWQTCLVGYSSWDHKIVRYDWATNTFWKAKEARSPLDKNPALLGPAPSLSQSVLPLHPPSLLPLHSTELKIKVSHVLPPSLFPFGVWVLFRGWASKTVKVSELDRALLVPWETLWGSLSADAQIGTQWMEFQTLENCDQ